MVLAAGRHAPAHLVETGEDMEKDLVTVSAAELKRYAEKLGDAEKAAVRAG